MTAGYTDFEFDLPGALLTHLVGVLDRMAGAPLDPTSLLAVPEAQGIYQLFLDNQIVYVGKTDAEAGLNVRLNRHKRKIQHRMNLAPARISFKAVRIYVFTAVDLETQLIRYYGGLSAVPWNGSGFGSNDPGRQRDTTEYKSTHFDAMFPIDIDRPLSVPLPRTGTAASILTLLKNILPYTLRFETQSRQPHTDLMDTLVTLPNSMMLNARNVVSEVIRQLPTGWQAVHLPSHIILYKESRNYSYGNVIARSL